MKGRTPKQVRERMPTPEQVEEEQHRKWTGRVKELG